MRAGATAARHETLAAAAATEQASGVHAATAALHRDVEALHLAVAGMAESQAARLDRWLSAPEEQAARPRLVVVVADLLGTPSAAAGLRDEGRAEARMSASDAMARAAWEAEALAAQGPGTQAWSAGKPCAATGQDLLDRWPLFAQAAAGLGVRSVVAAPIGLPAARIGAVCGYYRNSISTEVALAMADRVAAAVTRLLLQSAQALGPATVAFPGDQVVVHHATGMISAQVGCGLGDARDLLTARAYADGVPLAQAAATVMRGETQFGPLRLLSSRNWVVSSRW